MALNTTVAADFYKWSDGQRTHYGDTPPQAQASVERLQVDECADSVCERELERRRQETIAAYRELEAWLDRRAAQRKREQDPARSEYRLVVIPALVPRLDVLPGFGVGRRPLHAARHGVPRRQLHHLRPDPAAVQRKVAREALRIR